jgi:hypothetical protein
MLHYYMNNIRALHWPLFTDSIKLGARGREGSAERPCSLSGAEVCTLLDLNFYYLLFYY